MKKSFRPNEIPLLSAPVTASNNHNARNHPAVNLGCCTPFQLISNAKISYDGTVCVIGNPARGIGVAKAMIRRSQKPFLFLGTVADRNSVFSALDPEWVLDSATETMPRGNGAIFLRRSFAEYADIMGSMEDWAQDHIIIMHLSNGMQAGPEMLDLFSAIGQAVLFCDSVPQSIKSSEMHILSPLEFMRHMDSLLIFSSGSETSDLIQLLPKYQYERITNTTGFNTYNSRSIFHPFHRHRGHGFSANQTRTLEFKKDVFEMDDLQRIFGAGCMLVYNARQNTVFLAQIV